MTGAIRCLDCNPEQDSDLEDDQSAPIRKLEQVIIKEKLIYILELRC